MRISDWSSDVCSSDLWQSVPIRMTTAISPIRKPQAWESSSTCTIEQRLSAHRIELRLDNPARPEILGRSEEHTSELQSLMRISYAVFCLTKKHPQHISQYQLHYHMPYTIHTRQQQ